MSHYNINSHDLVTYPTIRTDSITSKRQKDGLLKYARNMTSQNGEDGIINRLFSIIPFSLVKNNTKERWCVDVGAWDGHHLSNTNSLLCQNSEDNYIFEKKGDIKNHKAWNENKKLSYWRGILIEADEIRFHSLESLYGQKWKQIDGIKNKIPNFCVHRNISCIPNSNDSLPNVLLEEKSKFERSNNIESLNFLPNDFDFLNIDIDGTDYWILQNVLSYPLCSYRPKVICIEFNPTIPHSIVYIPPQVDCIRHGSSLAALIELCQLFQYTIIETTLFNAFFIRNDLLYHLRNDLMSISIDKLHEMTMGTKIYQLYDGFIKIQGCTKLLWHRIKIDEKKIQIIDKVHNNRRKDYFPFAPVTSYFTKNIDIDNNVIDHTKTKHQKHNLLNDRIIIDSAVDISSYIHLDSEKVSNDVLNKRKKECSERLYNQMQDTGFALIRGVSSFLSSELCQQALEQTRYFLLHAPESVRRQCLANDRARRGYSPINTENFGTLLNNTKTNIQPNDLVRKFRLGSLLISENKISSNNRKENDIKVFKQNCTVDSMLLQPNLYPSVKSWNDKSTSTFRFVLDNYYRRCHFVANRIVWAICDGLMSNNPEYEVSLRPLCCRNTKYLDGEIICDGKSILNCKIKDSTSTLTLLGYKKGARHNGKFNRPLVAEHTDVSVITMLLYDTGDCAMLQRHSNTISFKSLLSGKTHFRIDSKWVDINVPSIIPQDPVFIVNVGDCLSELCNRILPSTLHRVIPRKCVHGDSRSCLAMFFCPKPDEHFVFLGKNSNFCTMSKSVTFEEWRKIRIMKVSENIDKKLIKKDNNI